MATEHDRIQNADHWDEWIEGGVPADVEAHAQTCTECRAVLDDLATMRLGLGALAEDTRAEAETIVPAVNEPTRKRWAAVGAGLAVAVVAAAAILSAPRVTIDAPDGATLWTADGPVAISGRVERDLPIEIETKDAQRVAVAEGFEILENSRVRIDDTDEAALLNGTLAIERAPQTTVSVAPASLLARGKLTVAHGQEHVMNMTNQYKIAAGGAVVAVALTAGWARLETFQDQAEAKAPAALTVGADGKIAKHDIDVDVPSNRAAGQNAATKAMALAADEAADETESERPSGAFWDSEKQAMFFALEGEVLDEVSGEAVPAFDIAAVAVESKGFAAGNRLSDRFAGKKDGRFRLEGFGLGEWRVTARAEGYAPVSQTVKLGDLSDDPYLVMPMSRGGALSGRVVDWRGQPVDGAKVGLLECFERTSEACRTVTTNSDGAFSIQGVPAKDKFAVKAEHERYGFAVRPNLSRRDGESEHVVIELSGVLRVFGRVTTGPDRTPVPNATVIESRSEQRIVTDGEGRYELFMPLESRPRVYVESKSRDGFVTKFASYPERRSVEAIRWVQAQTHVAELEKNFALAMETSRLFGRVTDAEGHPIAGVELALHNTTGWHGKRNHETFPERTVTNADGRYAIDGVPAKAGYTVSYKTKDGRKKLGYVNIREEKEVEANFTLGGGAIRGRMVHKDSGQPFRAAVQQCQRLAAKRLGQGGTFADPRCYDDGRFEFSDLAPGKYVLEDRVSWMDNAVQTYEREVVVAPGEVVEGVTVEVEGEEARTWQFRALTADGRFVPDPFLRYSQGGTQFTANLMVGTDGVAKFSLSDQYETVHLEATGYEAVKVDLSSRSPDAVIEVTMKRHER